MAIQPENPEVNYLPISDVSSFPASESTAEKPGTNTPAVQQETSNIVPSGGGSVMKGGEFMSPNYVKGQSGWRIGADGFAEFDDLDVRDNAYIGDRNSTHIHLDGQNTRIRSSNYVQGVSGFTIEPNLIEAENLIARGTIRGASFKYDVVSAVGGQLMVANSDTLASDMTALDASTLTTKGDTTFAVNDILVIRGVTASGIQEEWLRVTNIGSAPTYTVTRDLAASFSANSNPIWKAGTPVVKQGVSDGSSSYSGGWLRLLGEGTNSPHYSVFSRTGLAYNSYLERIRLGNLNGIGPFVADTYGIFIGNYSTGKYLTYDDGTGNLVVNGYVQSSKGAFGGDGSDGALSISSGTTTISAASAQVLIKNYTSISITGTGKLAFSTPNANGTFVFLKSQGNVTITSTTNPGIDCSSMGGNKGTGGGDGSGSGGVSGTAGSQGYGNIKDSNNGLAGQGGQAGSSTGGIASVAIRLNSTIISKVLSLTPGAGGGGGGSGVDGTGGSKEGLGGDGGRGGGCLIIECNGAYNFGASSYISVAGGNGTAGGVGSSVESGGGGGGGGGAGGMSVVLYNTLTANSGTYVISGGNGGNGGSKAAGGASSNQGGGAGGSGGAHVNAGGAGGNGGNSGNNGTDGTNGSGATGGTKGTKGTSGSGGSGGGGGGGGGGSEGLHFELLNSYFA